jgi:hypothetical protein
MINTATAALFGLSAYAGLLYIAQTPYKCKPYEPQPECVLSKYEVRIFDITTPEKHMIAMAEGACVFTVGEGRAKRIVMTDAEFHSLARSEYMDRVELPAAQSLVCEVK